MTDGIKKLIDELPKYDPHQIAKYSHRRAMDGLKSKLFAREDDVITLVEKLTGWTKVEDVLPEMDVKILFKRYEGTVYLGKMWRSKCFEANCMTIEGVTEWKPII